jgi:para-nitrobenzyl esterase
VAEANPLRVDTAYGSLEGFEHGEGIVAFRGVPFAAPPVGDLRWKAPQARPGKLREAKTFRRRMHSRNRRSFRGRLYLNVPQPREGDALPVHGLYGGVPQRAASRRSMKCR